MKDSFFLDTEDFRILFESAPGLLLVLTPDFRVAAASYDYFKTAARQREEILGRVVFEVFPGNSADGETTGEGNLRHSLERVLATRQPDAVRWQSSAGQQAEAKDGAILEEYWKASNVPVLDQSGGVKYIVQRVEDVTEKVLAQKRESEQQLISEKLRLEAKGAQTYLEQILSSTSDSFYRFDQDFRYVYVNRSTIEMFGIEERDFLGKSLWELFPEAEENRYHAELQRSFEEQKPIVFDNYYKPLDRWFENRVYPSPEGLSVFTSEITERKQTEERLRRSHETFFNLVQNAPFGIYIVDAEFRLAQISAGSRRVFTGVEPLLGRDFAEILRIIWDEPFTSQAIERFRHTLATGEPYRSFDTTEQRGNVESTESYDWKIERVTLPDGEFGVVCYFYDLTDQKRAEADLRQSEEKLRMATEAADIYSWEIDVQGGKLLWGANAASVLGFTPETFTESLADAFALVHADDLESTESAVQAAIAADQNFEIEFRLVNPQTGEAVWVSSQAAALRDDAGRVVRFVGVSQNISSRKRREANLAFLADIAADFARFSTVEELTRAVGERVVGYFDLSHCLFVEIDEKADEATVFYEHYAAGETLNLVGTYALSNFHTEEERQALFAGNTVVVNDARCDPPRPRATAAGFQKLGIGSLITAPFLSEGRWKFALSAQCRAPRCWRRDEAELLSELAGGFYLRLERARAEEHLQKALEQLQTALEAAQLGIWQHDLTTNIVSLDERARSHYGIESVAVSLEEIISRVHPDDAPRLAREVAAAMDPQSDGKFFTEYRVVHSDESVHWLAVNVRVQFAGSGSERRAIHGFGTSQDITERRLAETALRESEEKFRDLADNISQLVWMTDADGWIFWYNERWFEYTGTSLAEMQGWGWQKVHHPEWVEQVTGKFKQAIVAGETWEDVFPLRSKNGEYRWFLSRALPIRDAAGKIVRWFGTNTDVTDLRNTRRELEEANALLDTLFDQAPIGLGYWDERLRFSRVNQALAEMNGFPVEEHLGKTVAELLPEVAAGVMEAFQKVVETGEAIVNLEAEGETPAAPGEQRFWSVSYYPIRLEEKIAGIGAVCEEITERKRAEALREQLLASEQQARREAETANRLKDEFLATVSHELRTPLNAMLGWSTIVRQNGFDPEMMRRAMEIIERNARNQEQIIADILDVSRIVTGKLAIAFEAVELGSVVKSAVDTMRPAIEAKNIVLRTDFSKEFNLITGDASRLQQVFWNLLSNAVKFTPEAGEILITLRRDGKFAEIAVKDSGEGINPDFLPFVFDRFRQAQGGSNRKHGGLGLGLAIVRHLVELHGGSVSVESLGKGSGTTFTVKLPLFAAAYQMPGDMENIFVAKTDESFPKVENKKLAGARILVVDDEQDARELLGVILTGAGASTTLAGSVADALGELKAAVFDCLVSDLGMPGEDGFDLIRQIKNSARLKNLPAIALTAYARDDDSKRSLAAGYDRHLPKPVDSGLLIETISDLIAESGALGESTEENVPAL